MASEYCPKCLLPRNMSFSTSVREQSHSEGEIKKITTNSYQCEVCHSFVRSEEFKATDDDSRGETTTNAAAN